MPSMDAAYTIVPIDTSTPRTCSLTAGDSKQTLPLAPAWTKQWSCCAEARSDFERQAMQAYSLLPGGLQWLLGVAMAADWSGATASVPPHDGEDVSNISCPKEVVAHS